jgi:hypothetical protein
MISLDRIAQGMKNSSYLVKLYRKAGEELTKHNVSSLILDLRGYNGPADRLDYGPAIRG